jgi:uncharacterized protein (DUF885 family)
MGLFDKPEDYFGHLNDEMLRAVRLVVDTGMHAKGWTREQSIQYMRETLGYTEADARNATERYMAWPAQALGYKIGQLEILKLRQYAKDQLGDRFDLRGFHDEVLSGGALPMDVLGARIRGWVEQKKAQLVVGGESRVGR